MARYEAIGEFDEDGDRIADAVQDEADTIVFEANDDHGRLADAAATRIPRRADRPAGVLTLGATGAMAGGQFGTAMGAVQAATYADRHVHVYVLEGRPRLDGARVAVWELAQAGIPHTLVTDAAAGWLLQGGTIDVVLVGAEGIALNGDVANDVGSYPVAALAVRHNVPLIVCAPLAAVDPAAPDGNALVNDERPRREVVELAKSPLTLADTAVMNPAVDITPAGLVTAFATEEGLIEGSFGRELQAALERRAARHPSFAAGSPPIAEAGATGPAGSGT
jgi:methylthioribose-1-phosphate isomerase